MPSLIYCGAVPGSVSDTCHILVCVYFVCVLFCAFYIKQPVKIQSGSLLRKIDS